MSEKIYACLLYLYPARFRKTYGEEALQLFRDRSREEAGFLSQQRLWVDLLMDLVISVPREHRRVHHAVASVSPQHRESGVLSFYLSVYQPPRLGSLLCAGVLSLLTFGLMPFSITHGRDVGSSSRPAQPPASAYIPAAGIQAPAGAVKIDAAERSRVVDAAIRNVKQYYFDPRIAQEAADALSAREKRGEYDAVAGAEELAGLLTAQLRAVSHDMHLEVVYSSEPIPVVPAEPTPAMLAAYQREMQRENCTFETAKILPQNIGYLKLNSFPDVSVCRATATKIMASFSQVDAIIFDLRGNGGGDGDMVSLIASYLFDHPEFLYDPRTNPTLRSWTQPVPGSRLTDKPVYILTSRVTISAAEQFAYDLKMLHRATLVGERTHGSAHAGVFHRIDEHFGMGIPRLKPINPFSNADWEGTGVEPDVTTKTSDALETAEKLATSRLRKNCRADTRPNQSR